MHMPVSTWVEVDLDQFARNLGEARRLAGPGCDILLVAKADAYGHGAVDMVQAAQEEGVGHFGVATLHEGIEIRRAGVAAPLVVLSPLLPSEAGEAVAHDLAPSVCDLEFARALSREAQQQGRPARCHVEIDTGMGRIGVREERAEGFLREIVALPGLRLASIYTHFPDADAEDLAFARGQTERFRALAETLARVGIRPPRLHAANSAGLVNLPEARFDWARVGLLAYGYPPANARARVDVGPVMSFKSRLVQVRDLPAGASISYGRTFTAPRAMKVGVVAVGYGHGYSWLLSGQGQMLVGGARVPVLGRVTMDLTMVDLAGAPHAAVGDEVVLFGSQGEARVGIEEVAAWCRTLHYEIMCTIGKRVTRIYVRGARPAKVVTLVGEREAWTHAAADHFRAREQALTAARRR